MNTHDVGRGRGGIAAALARITAPVVVGRHRQRPAVPDPAAGGAGRAIPTCTGLQVVASPYGHDGFLIEIDAVSQLVRQTLAAAQA